MIANYLQEMDRCADLCRQIAKELQSIHRGVKAEEIALCLGGLDDSTEVTHDSMFWFNVAEHINPDLVDFGYSEAEEAEIERILQEIYSL